MSCLRLVFVTICLMLGMCSWASDDGLLIFNLNNFDGWNYNREGTNFNLNTDNISHKRIRLFRSQTGIDYVLTSPEFDVSKIDTLNVSLCIMTDNTTYTASKLEVSFVINNVAGDKLVSVTAQVKPGELQQDIDVAIPVKELKGSVKLMLAAWKATKDENFAVHTIVARESAPILKGDINQDGVVDITDMNFVVNAVLSSSRDKAYDVNEDGIVDIVDINFIANIVLG